MPTLWIDLAVISIISLLFFWRGRNSVWSGMQIGAIIALVWSIGSALFGSGFHWSTIAKGAVVGTLLGLVAELLGKLSDRLKRRQ